MFFAEWAIRIGNWLALWGVRRARTRGAVEVATGDHLTKLGLLYGVERELDDEFRSRLLSEVWGINRAVYHAGRPCAMYDEADAEFRDRMRQKYEQ